MKTLYELMTSTVVIDEQQFVTLLSELREDLLNWDNGVLFLSEEEDPDPGT